ncbi:hypothetical protein PF001_g8466 [Phytophthora fragariae]|uniref:Uncharacterized protein n=1 Tax=Phytophthora fragariae TaxID=53985 RepID=A0A6A4E054_9STRA|nr:hypothetical protein PF001_g8466 [Phytophthora fragariae]
MAAMVHGSDRARRGSFGASWACFLAAKLTPRPPAARGVSLGGAFSAAVLVPLEAGRRAWVRRRRKCRGVRNGGFDGLVSWARERDGDGAYSRSFGGVFRPPVATGNKQQARPSEVGTVAPSRWYRLSSHFRASRTSGGTSETSCPLQRPAPVNRPLVQQTQRRDRRRFAWFGLAFTTPS